MAILSTTFTTHLTTFSPPNHHTMTPFFRRPPSKTPTKTAKFAVKIAGRFFLQK
jgi:hypothetical protein